MANFKIWHFKINPTQYHLLTAPKKTRAVIDQQKIDFLLRIYEKTVFPDKVEVRFSCKWIHSIRHVLIFGNEIYGWISLGVGLFDSH